MTLHAPVPAVTTSPSLSRAPALAPPRPDREALVKAIHGLVERAGVVRDGWNGFNVIHDNASRVAALDIGFAPSAAARARAGPVKVTFLLGADDYDEAAVPKDAFVVYQVRPCVRMRVWR